MKRVIKVKAGTENETQVHIIMTVTSDNLRKDDLAHVVNQWRDKLYGILNEQYYNSEIRFEKK